MWFYNVDFVFEITILNWNLIVGGGEKSKMKSFWDNYIKLKLLKKIYKATKTTISFWDNYIKLKLLICGGLSGVMEGFWDNYVKLKLVCNIPAPEAKKFFEITMLN